MAEKSSAIIIVRVRPEFVRFRLKSSVIAVL
jgi:hypothetical protein